MGAREVRPKPGTRLRGWIPLLLTVTACGAACLLAYEAARRFEFEANRAALQRYANELATQVTLQTQGVESSVAAIRGLFAASRSVERD